MNNREAYDRIFRAIFLLTDEDLSDKDVLNVENWNSLEHFVLLQRLGDQFGIQFSENDILYLTSYEKGLEILRQHGVQIETTEIDQPSELSGGTSERENEECF